MCIDLELTTWQARLVGMLLARKVRQPDKQHPLGTTTSTPIAIGTIFAQYHKT